MNTPQSAAVDARGATGVAIGDRAQVIQYLGATYNIYQAAESGVTVSAMLKDRLKPVFARNALFGGRTTQLRALDDFLSRSLSGYLFVTGRSGFGKTALLSNWIRSLEANGVPVCYHFISRFDGVAGEEATLGDLCQQLLAYHEMSGTLPPGAAIVRSVYGRLLTIPPPDGARLVVVIDGLDEAVDWKPRSDLFPPLPQGVFVVFSAREIAGRDWLAELELDPAGAHVLDLQTLSLADVAELLRTALNGDPAPTTEPEFAAIAFDKSGGDPFYLRYLIEDIRSGITESAAELSRQPRGLKAYLDRWWDDVSRAAGEKAVRDLLGYLLVAKGRLTRDDLTNISDADVLDGFVFDNALEQVRRYVVGSDEQGYTLTHPRFRDYLGSERIKQRDQEPYRRALIEYCGRWADNHSAYAFDYYAAHLRDAGQLDELLALLDNTDWYDAQMARDPTAGAFLDDVAQVWAATESATERSLAAAAAAAAAAALLGREVQCALIWATVRSFLEHVPASLLTALVQYGIWTEDQALNVIQLESDSVDALTGVAPFLSPNTIGRALDIARSIVAPAKRVSALSAVLPHLDDSLKPVVASEALEATRRVGRRSERVIAVATVLPHLAPAARESAGRDAAAEVEHIDDLPRRIQAAAALVPVVSERAEELVRVALAAVDARPPGGSMYSLNHVWPHLSPPDQDRLLRQALQAANEDGPRLDDLLNVVDIMPMPGKAEMAGQVLAAVTGSGSPATVAEVIERVAAALIAGAVAVPDLTQALLDAADRIGESGDRIRALRSTAPLLTEAEQRTLAYHLLDIAREVATADVLISTIASVAPYLAPAEIPDALAAALRFTRNVFDGREQVAAYLELAPLIPEERRAAYLRERVVAAWSALLPDLKVRGAVLLFRAGWPQEELDRLTREVVQDAAGLMGRAASGDAGDRDEKVETTMASLQSAMQRIQTMADTTSAVAIIGALLPYNPKLQNRSLMEPMFASLGSALALPSNAADALCAMAATVAPEWISSVLEYASRLTDQESQARVIVAVAPRLAGESLTKALEVAAAVDDPNWRAVALSALIPALPDDRRDAVLEQAFELAFAPAVDAGDEPVSVAQQEAIDFSDLKLTRAGSPPRSDQPQCCKGTRAALAVLANLASYSEERRQAIVTAITERARNTASSTDRATLHAGVLPQLDAQEREAVLAEAVAAAERVDSPRDRALLASRLAELAPHRAHELWRSALHNLAGRGRTDLLDGLPALAPCLMSMAGSGGVTECAAAIASVVARWR